MKFSTTALVSTLFILVPSTLAAPSVQPVSLSTRNETIANADDLIEARAGNGKELTWNARSDWIKDGLKRRRTQFWVKPNTKKAQKEFCDAWNDKGNFILPSNFQCYWNTELKIWCADVSFANVPLGDSQFKDSRQRALNEWRARTKGDVFEKK
ncbi:hypothetical protein DM02DRAFT_657028 [Periconia macrospinosa]|uniref:Uncharacterized protein n=1 Tax=Periconia macrospinosa TaxID=97972 RepID=A0A2V1DL02_9PLEO|nr:hypothetical protein DM02DRAFT_657028 [Periconia macrospinosa]